MATTTPNIISVSRRSDVPAWHGKWFAQRLKDGFAEYRNPFSGALHRVSLLPEDVIGFVFWSKNFSGFHDILADVDKAGYLFYCHFTITGLDKNLEPGMPSLASRLACFRELSRIYGTERVLWRFDPIVISSACSADETFRRFSRLLNELAGHTHDCYVSFVQFYGKVKKRFARLEQETGVRVFDPPLVEKRDLLARMAEEAARANVTISVCCQDELVGGGVEKAHCVAIERFRLISGRDLPPVPRRGTRKQCGCSQSRDIGAYDTCRHGCVYCYASS